MSMDARLAQSAHMQTLTLVVGQLNKYVDWERAVREAQADEAHRKNGTRSPCSRRRPRLNFEDD